MLLTNQYLSISAIMIITQIKFARKNTCREHIKQTKFKRKTVYIPDYQRFTKELTCTTYDHFNES